MNRVICAILFRAMGIRIDNSLYKYPAKIQGDAESKIGQGKDERRSY
jgi:hypothetical protein